jgi:hypothetical protein
MPERVILHVGTHKTGTTSLQQFLGDENDGLLAAAGAFFPPGFMIPRLHSDLPLLTLRPDLVWPMRLRFPETQSERWLAAAEAHVRGQVRTATRDVLVYSQEDLSYARFDHEVERLADLFDGLPVTVVVFLRDRRSFLDTYTAQLTATGFPLSDDPASFSYVRDDSWLLDYDALVDTYRRGFGSDNVKVFDYDAAVAADTTVIPAFAELLGIPRDSLPPLGRYFLNRTGRNFRPTDEQLAAIRERVVEQAT